MRLISDFLVLFLCVHTVRLSSIEDNWSNFKINFNKTYKNSEEETKRFEIFKENFEFITNHNGNKTFKFKVHVNRFADVSEDEVVAELEEESK